MSDTAISVSKSVVTITLGVTFILGSVVGFGARTLYAEFLKWRRHRLMKALKKTQDKLDSLEG